MPITAGGTGRADDFIYRSEAQTDRTDDEGRVPKLEASGKLHPDFTVPTATILEYAGADDDVDDGFLLCDGASYLRADYPELFAKIGTTYGSADSTHFNVPNKKGRVGVGYDASQVEFDVLGEQGGAKTVGIDHTHTGPSHVHYITQNGNARAGGGDPICANANTVVGSTAAGTGNTGTMSANSNPSILQPYIALNYIIKT